MSSNLAALRRSPRHTAQVHAPPILNGIEVMPGGRVEPFLHAHPCVSSASVGRAGVAIEEYSVPARVVHRHEHVENFIHVVLRGSGKYEVLTRGKVLDFQAGPGTTFILPQGTIDEVRWKESTHRIAVDIHPNLLVSALNNTHESSIELIENWSLNDRNIIALLLAMKTDLDSGSPAGRLYGESLANTLAVYLLKRYTGRGYTPATYQGGLPGYRLRRVLDYIGENLAADLSLSELAGVAGMSPHYFAELFRRRYLCGA
jgi:AraC family transcriptional regulator